MKIVAKIFFLFLIFIPVTILSQEDKLQHFTVSDGLPSLIINDIKQDEIGYLWLATDKGFSKFDGNNFTNFSNEKTTTLCIHKNTLYVGLKTGLLIKKANETLFLKSKEVQKITVINKEVIIGTVQGIYILKDDLLQPLNLQSNIDFSIIHDIISFKNLIFIASNNGLWALNKLQKPAEVTTILEGNFVSLLISDHKLIAATYNNGLKLIDLQKGIVTIATAENNTSIKKIENEIWATSKNNGIDIFNAQNFSFKQKINKYNTSISNQINTVFKDNQNTIWVATKKGLYKFMYSNFKTRLSSVKPTIYLENIAVNYKNIADLNSNNLKLKPTDNNLSFRYKTINLNLPKSTLYRYKLTENYSPWSSKNRIEFANLNAGKYTFKVQSKIENQISNEAFFSFQIALPIYKKPWFIILCCSIVLFIASGFIDVYIKKVNKKNKQKVTALELENHLLSLQQKALQLQMNPHFIFNVLNGIKALGNSGNTKELNNTISQFAILLRSVLNNSRLEEISLHDEIETIKNYLDLEQKMNTKAFEYSIETNLNNIDADEILIPPMLVQPFIENSIKHGIQPNSKNGTIDIQFNVKHQFLHCKIIDNGIGFHQSNKRKESTNHSSIALKVTKERIQNLSKHSAISIQEIMTDKEVIGTKVNFKIPLKMDY